MSAYITSVGRFLPGSPIDSDDIEQYIGTLGPGFDELRQKVVHNSGIRTRHYALDREQRTLHSTKDMATGAVRDALASRGIGCEDIDLLAVGSGTADLMAPGIASMVHGELGAGPCEIMSMHGVCCAGMMALKDAYVQVRAGEKTAAVACAAEFNSRNMKSTRFAAFHNGANGGEKARVELAFLRYMLSDGAGALVVEPTPAPTGLSFRIEWISLQSYAHTTKACMYMGSTDNDAERSWLDYETVGDAAADGALILRQELRLLPRLVRMGVDEYERLLGLGQFDPGAVKRVGAHYSSAVIKPALLRELARRGCPAPPPESWYSNLESVGNMGSASIYLIIGDLLADGGLEHGDQVVCFVPESGRFTMSYMLLTAVEAGS